MAKIIAPDAPKGFHEVLGLFHAIWQALDVVIDFAIGHFRGLDATATLSLVKGKTFGTKLADLEQLVDQSSHPQKLQIKELLAKLKASKRNEITHSYLDTEVDEVKFIYNGDRHGRTPAYSLPFTGPSFEAHVADFSRNASAFQNALAFPRDELDKFADLAALGAPPRP